MSAITATSSLPPSITIFNTAYDRPWTEDETRLLSELIGQQQLTHYKVNNTTSTATNPNSISGIAADTQTTSVETDTTALSIPKESNITFDACVTNPFKINWLPISMKLGRATTSLIKKYNLMKQVTYKHGTFTNAEDVHIIKRYLEWMCVYKDNAKSGIWSLLERELNRKDKRISERWRHVLCKRLATIVPLGADNSIIDPLKALIIWKKHREEIGRQIGGSVHNNHGATNSSSSSISMNKVSTPASSDGNDSVLKKRAYSATDSIISENSLNTTGAINIPVQTINSNAGPITASSTTDSPMNDVNNLIQSIHNEEYTNNSILSIGNSFYDDNVYGGSLWNTIDNNNNQPFTNGEQGSHDNANHSEHANIGANEEDPFSSSVWNSITSTQPEYNKRSKGMTRWTEEQDDRLREAVSLFPRDWTKISEYMGIEESNSKCRKRWARLQQKYQLSLSTALQDATNCSFQTGEPELDPDGDPDWELDLEPDENPDLSNAQLNFSLLDENGTDAMELYRDLQDIRGDLDL